MSDENRLEINWVNSLGAALGAVSAAVLLSSLGAAGTLLGAALGSLCITIGGALYAHSLKVAKQRVTAAQALAARRRTRGRETRSVDVQERDTDALGASLDTGEVPVGESRWQMLRELPWKRILVVSAALFAVSMAAIVAFELATGRPVSTMTGGTSDTDRGTSVPGVGGGDTSDDDAPEGEPRPQDGPVEQGEDPAPAEDPEPAPVEEPTVEPVPTATAEPQETAAP